jgi:hypothetical protein
VVLAASALQPLAVLSVPLVLFSSAPAPTAVLKFKSVGAVKKPFMSMITSATEGPELYTLTPPEFMDEPAGTMAALATI